MPFLLSDLAHSAALAGGYEDFAPDACLINCYTLGTKLSLHQDKDEKDMSAPIVSFSLGLSAQFQFGGLTRASSVKKYTLNQGDCVVWGGATRLAFHGILPIKDNGASSLESQRINLTFRKAL
jgi:alkylated DNA repair protein (DNA oxidative demethylase)